ncbi:MAG TPA: hypothetical protein VJ850_09675 [Candidatus Limnocylindrales bacterium]|nr:hypothetical protein [Candidatus Limnocylindrales bacterium]
MTTPGIRREAERAQMAVRPGDPDEINRLVRASQQRRLTDQEGLRLAALTWVPDETMERAALLRDRHPDVFSAVTPSEIAYALVQTYLPRKAAAAEAGKTVPAPSEALVAEIDTLATDYRTLVAPDFHDIESRNRAAFRIAVSSGDFAAMIGAWARWLAEHQAAIKVVSRRAGVLSGLGRPSSPSGRPEPGFLRELEDAAGGTIGWRSVSGSRG